jgi:hypothetical protein
VTVNCPLTISLRSAMLIVGAVSALGQPIYGPDDQVG